MHYALLAMKLSLTVRDSLLMNGVTQEIKKLQRLRDQIKTWQGDSSIKDKTKLDANRKLIEEKMEKFKVCEKETKTKAFSKEGLAQDRTDPKQKAKSEINDWIGDAIRKIQEQNEEMESEIELLNSGKRRKRNDENPRVAELKEFTSRNEKHISMLERVLRAVDNDAVSPAEVGELRESVDYYIESNQDPDFYEDDEMYDSLDLDSIPAPAPASATRKSRDIKSEDHSDSTTPTNAERSGGGGSAKKGQSPKHPSASKSRGGNSRSSRQNNSPARKTTNTVPAQSPGLNGAATVQSPRVRPGGPLLSSVVKSGSAAAAAKQSHSKFPVPSDNVARQIFPQKTTTPTGPSSFSETLKPSPVAQPSVGGMRWNGVVAGTSGRDASTSTPTNLATAATQKPGPGVPPLSGLGSDRLMRGSSAAGSTQGSVSEMLSSKEACRKGSGSSGPAASSDATNVPRKHAYYNYNPSIEELERQRAALERASKMVPEDWFGSFSFDIPPASTGATSTPSALSPRNPVAVPPSFPNVPSSVFDKPNIFLKFDPDTLFFIFYYQQGTLQQYLAAKELKRQGWRFHKKYLTWFQRHDEPKIVNDEYETGTFIYFDYANVVFRGQGSGWCQRIKSEFVFEYRYLEDELQV